MMRAERRGCHWLIGGQGEVTEVEAGSHCAPHQGICPPRAGRLPPARRHGMHRELRAIEGTQPVLLYQPPVCRGRPKVEWCALIEMPNLIGLNSVPAAHRPLRQEKVDRGKRGSLPPSIRRVDHAVRPVQLSVIAPFGVGDQPQGCNQRRSAVC